jgi:hypothetical protein
MRVKSSAVWMDEKMVEWMERHLAERMEARLAYCLVGRRVDLMGVQWVGQLVADSVNVKVALMVY